MKLGVKYLKHLSLLTLNKAKGRIYLRNVKDCLYCSTNNDVPYVSQFGLVTKEKAIEKIAVEDNVFLNQGYPSKKEFSFWSSRVCGVACIKMVLESHGKAKDKSLWDLISSGLEIGGYKLYDTKGNFVDIGWYHKPLLQLAQSYNIHGYLKQSLDLYSVACEIVKGSFVIASVKVPDRASLESDGSYFKSDYNGQLYNHLVLLTAVSIRNGMPDYFLAHNPTGYDRYEKNSKIDASTFTRIFNGRAVIIKAE
ncbi:MAG: hypothetical protein RLY61_380 [Candidatus Parcubacteria bacterium]|jgi:hypothetical protein